MKFSNIYKITKTDALSLLLFISPLVLLVMSIAPFIFGEISIKRSFNRTGTLDFESSQFFTLFGLCITPICLLAYYKRLTFINSVLSSGYSIKGVVNLISFQGDRGSIVYSYRLSQVEYTTTNRIMKNSITKKIRQGDKVTVLYNPKKPKKPKNAFISQIY